MKGWKTKFIFQVVDEAMKKGKKFCNRKRNEIRLQRILQRAIMRVFVHEKCIKENLSRTFKSLLKMVFYVLTKIRFESSDTLECFL